MCAIFEITEEQVVELDQVTLEELVQQVLHPTEIKEVNLPLFFFVQSKKLQIQIIYMDNTTS